MYQHVCRICRGALFRVYDFGPMPVANIFPLIGSKKKDRLYPLDLCICTSCGLLQLGYIVPAERIFPQYPYASHASYPLVVHLRTLADRCIRNFHLNKESKVLDIGANDGTLLTAFEGKVGLCVGVDPAKTILRLVENKNMHFVPDFFTDETAKEIVRTYGTFDLICATNVLANVIDFHDFFRGVARALAPKGTLVIEVGSADTIMNEGCFDSVYHEHYAYFSRSTIRLLLSYHNLDVTRIEHIAMHGGSLRVTAVKRAHMRQKKRVVHGVTNALIAKFRRSMDAYKNRMETLFVRYRGKTVVGFGAPAKAVTLLHTTNLTHAITAVVDDTPSKQGHMIPATGIPIYEESYLTKKPIHAIMLLSWNYSDEILKKIRSYDLGHPDIIVPFPRLHVIEG